MNHTQLLNELIKKQNLKSYCEIGVFNRTHNFNKIVCPFKYCIDPDPKAQADFIGTSDEFFKTNKRMFSIFFIDGLHISIQVYKDITNALAYLEEGGFIVVHDLLPTSKLCQDVPRVQGEWTGDCWMAFTWLRALRDDLTMYTIDADYGVGVIQKGKQDPITINENITYENFEKNKKEWLNLITYESISNYAELKKHTN